MKINRKTFFAPFLLATVLMVSVSCACKRDINQNAVEPVVDKVARKIDQTR